jgi:hypothetical protein
VLARCLGTAQKLFFQLVRQLSRLQLSMSGYQSLGVLQPVLHNRPLGWESLQCEYISDIAFVLGETHCTAGICLPPLWVRLAALGARTYS